MILRSDQSQCEPIPEKNCEDPKVFTTKLYKIYIFPQFFMWIQWTVRLFLMEVVNTFGSYFSLFNTTVVIFSNLSLFF